MGIVLLLRMRKYWFIALARKGQRPQCLWSGNESDTSSREVLRYKIRANKIGEGIAFYSNAKAFLSSLSMRSEADIAVAFLCVSDIFYFCPFVSILWLAKT